MLTLTGTTFQPPGGASQVTVHFDTIPIAVSPSNDTSLTVAVPSGAKSGPVTLTTSALVGGQWVEQTSNGEDILVLWSNYLPGTGLGYVMNVLPGDADDLHLVTYHSGGAGQFWFSVWDVKGDGTANQESSFLSDAGFFQNSSLSVSRNPATSHVLALYTALYANNPYCGVLPCRKFSLRDLASGVPLLSALARYDPATGFIAPEDYVPMAFGFDAQGTCLLLAVRFPCVSNGGYGGFTCPPLANFWRLPPSSLDGSTVDLAALPSLLASPIALNFPLTMSIGETLALSVAPDGSAMARFSGCTNCQTATCFERLVAVPPTGSPESVQEISSPISPIAVSDPCWIGENHRDSVASDCMGRFYLKDTRWGPPPDYATAGPIYRISKTAPGGSWESSLLAGAELGGPAPYYPWVLAADGYGNLYEYGVNSPQTFQREIHRFAPSELADPNYYDTFNCCPANVPLAGLVHKARGEQLQIECSTGTLKLKLTPEPGDPISGDPGDLNAFAWITPDADGRADASVLFGQAPNLEAVWQDHPGGAETGETVKWEVSQELAPSADPKGLYPSKPELLFTGGAAPYTNSALQFQTVHMGTFVLKATTANRDHKGANGQPAFIEVTVTVAAPAGLLDFGPPPPSVRDFNALYIQYADKYGIPPQYIKSQAYEESGKEYNPDAYRYEPLSYDKDIVSGWPDSKWATLGYAPFRYPDGPGLSERDFRQRDYWTHIIAQDFRVQPPVLPYTCDTIHRSEVHAYLYDIFIADDGWGKDTYPHLLYNDPGQDLVVGPCSPRRMNWSLNAKARVAWHDNLFYCGTVPIGPPNPFPADSCTDRQQSLITWFSNHWDYESQTAVSASYGLMQVMYTTAVETRHWREHELPINRDPADLFNPSTSLDLGVGYDEENIKEGPFAKNPKHAWSSLLNYQEALVQGFLKYNSGRREYQIGLHIQQGYQFRPY